MEILLGKLDEMFICLCLCLFDYVNFILTLEQLK